MNIIGVDPGVSGAIAFIDRAGRCVIDDLPTLLRPGTGMIRRKLDGKALYDLIRSRIDPLETVLFAIEDVATLGGAKAAQIQGSLQYSKAVIETVAGIGGYHTVLVHVRTWQKFFGLTNDKDESLRLAKQLYPDAPITLKRHHNKAEALLIAHYARRNLC